MALNKQIHIYSVDTSAFYNKNEKKIHRKLNKNYNFRNKLAKIKSSKELNDDDKTEFEDKIKKYISNCSKRISKYKEKIYEEFKNNEGIRHLDRNYIYYKNKKTNKEEINKKNIISIFDSTLTRIMQIPENTVTINLIIVQTYFFEVLEDIITEGFIFEDDKYVCLTASAGQIRTKKTVFIKESILLELQNTLTCGLTLDIINKHGGVNVNKYLAYLALSNSATDLWGDFNIDKAIVVTDMETLVDGEVDLISDEDYSITRQKMKIPIPHTDGCGMILPFKSSKNFMCRLPWVKGLLVSFPYDKFIREKNREGKKTDKNYNCGIIKDIYGVEHDILEERIEVIFTENQFKMYKYYNSWEQYQDNFRKYNCQAGKCNEEEDKFSSAKLNYQMLQTLTDMTDNELKEISKLSIQNIKNIGTNKKTMLKVLGVIPSNTNKNHIQQALEIYPELLNDTYCKEILKQTKKSLVCESKAGKLDLGKEGTYTFLIPDLYAFCEWTFLRDKNPKGLLKNKEVYCNIFKNEPKLDCLRSPHLYREHALRNNVVDKEKGKWFITSGLYTSCHDIISKILMFDVDGDKSLVCCNHTLIKSVEKHMDGIVPLYYNMKKAQPQIITNRIIYEGLKSAYKGGNIGMYSNNIMKIWNHEKVNLEAIKLLCMENNFTIDYAKTLYKPKRPKDKKDMITDYTKLKTPHFFIYAKDKEKDKVEKINNSVVNRLEKIIPNPNINFKAMNLGNFDYTDLMKNKDIKLDETIINEYTKLDLKKHFMINKTSEEEVTNIPFLYQEIREKLLKINNNEEYVVDVLVKYLYKEKKSSFKTTLWECFGNIIVNNLKNNIKENYILCERCGERIKKTTGNKTYCDKCAKEIKKEQDRIRMKNIRKIKK